MNPKILLSPKTLYLYYYDNLDIEVLKYKNKISSIYVCIDEIINKPLVDLLFVISNLKEYKVPIGLMTNLSLDSIPQHIIGYFDVVLQYDNVKECFDKEFLKIPINIYAKERDY